MMSPRKNLRFLVLLGYSVILACVIVRTQNRINSTTSCDNCNILNCPLRPERCSAGFITDLCDCCTICAVGEGMTCDLDVINDNKGIFRQLTYRPRHGKCGNNLVCAIRPDIGAKDKLEDSALCQCKDRDPVCSSDGRTYRNRCFFDEFVTDRYSTASIVRNKPCDEVPRILFSPESLYVKAGEQGFMVCEVYGYPTPFISWKYDSDIGYAHSVPGDNHQQSVASRGGPGSHQTTAWILFHNFTSIDQGTYTCIAKNEIGTTMASASVKLKDDA